MKPENPPAFPTRKALFTAKQDANGETHIEQNGESDVGGMTLRDYFAGQALIGNFSYNDVSPEQIARTAYVMADAMLKARQS